MESKVVIKDIEWSISRTGLLTPVAIFDDIVINNNVINRVELHHKDYIINNKIGIGDTIGIKYESRKPMIIENYTKSGTYEIPTHCPVCNAILRERHAKLFCTHVTCKAVKAAHINHYCSVMSIRGLSYQRIMKLFTNKHFHRLEDLYIIKNHKVAFRNLLGYDLFNNVLDNVEKSITNCTLGQLIYALSMSNKTIADSLERYCRNDIDTFIYLAEKNYDWREAGLSEFWSDYVNSMYSKYHRTFIALSKILFIIPYIPKEDMNDKFVGVKFVVSGSPKIFSCRDSIIRAIEFYGGRVFGDLNDKIDYYIDCGSLSGMKNKAKRLGVKTLTEEGLIDMIENTS